MRNIKEKILIGAFVMYSALFLCAETDSAASRIGRAEELSQEIRARLGQKKKLLPKHEEFLFPEFSDGEFYFFIELNRMSPLVKSLKQSIADSRLSSHRKEVFLQRTTPLSKEQAWEEILLTLPETSPLLLPGTDTSTPSQAEIDAFLRNIKEIKKLEGDYSGLLMKSPPKEELGHLKMRYFEKILKILPASFNREHPEVEKIYDAFFREVFLPWLDMRDKEKTLSKETRIYLREVCAGFVERIRKIDSPLKDYIYLRLYEKMRAGTH